MIAKREVARHIGQLCLDLRKMALSVDNKMLAYLLDMAALEAVKMEVKECAPAQKEKKHFRPVLVV